jgi:hypothetical protein
MRKTLTALICFLSFGLIGQNIVVNEKSGNSKSYSIRDINKITFQSGDVVIETQSATENFSLTGLRHLVFEQVITEVEDFNRRVSELSAYPNPCGDVLNVSQNNTNARYFIYDFKGRLVQADKASSTINVSNLKTGIYFFKLTDETNTQTLKIIKK